MSIDGDWGRRLRSGSLFGVQLRKRRLTVRRLLFWGWRDWWVFGFKGRGYGEGFLRWRGGFWVKLINGLGVRSFVDIGGTCLLSLESWEFGELNGLKDVEYFKPHKELTTFFQL